MSMLSTPVLFLIFNRPEVTNEVFDQIRKAQPKQLFIGADGPRKNKPGDQALCEESRQIVLKGIDWPCEVKTLFREENLGCKVAVSSAISWFFENVEAGIILEDDTLPDLTFFRFCEELLAKYKDDHRVMSVAGTNLLGKWKEKGQSYLFGHGGIWGWASWRRSWQLYDITMSGWRDPKVKEKIRSAFHTEEWFRFYEGMMDASFEGSMDTWDVQWLYSILIQNGLVINPSVNLVTNLGFAQSGSHTHSSNNPLAQLQIYPMSFPLVPPLKPEVDVMFLKQMYSHITSPSKSNLSGTFRDLKAGLKKWFK
jgi:hypothetical protein